MKLLDLPDSMLYPTREMLDPGVNLAGLRASGIDLTREPVAT